MDGKHQFQNFLKMDNRYTYICRISTNWVNVEKEFEIDWMTKKDFDSKRWDDGMLEQDVIQEIGLEYEIVEGDGPNEPAILITNLSYIGCDEEEQIYDTYNEAVGQDYEAEAVIQQGISWEVIEVDNLKEIRKEKLDNLKKI